MAIYNASIIPEYEVINAICWDAWTWPHKRINIWPVEELKSILIKL
jgi:hypothetical protein